MELQLHLVFLVLLAAVLHASWNAVVKSSGDRFLSFTAIRGTANKQAIMVPVPRMAAIDFCRSPPFAVPAP